MILLRYLTVAMLVALFASGCASLKVVDQLNGQQLSADGEALAHIYGDTYGVYLFYYIPLVAGRTERPGAPAFFSHTVKIDKVVDMVTKKSEELGASELADLQSFTYSKAILPIILWSRRVEVSGNAIR